MIERKATHFFIVKDEEQDESWCKCWSNESLLMWHDALTAENDMKLSSWCNYASSWSSTCICKHAQREHDICESLLRLNDKHNESIRSFDHYDLSYVSNYQNMQR